MSSQDTTLFSAMNVSIQLSASPIRSISGVPSNHIRFSSYVYITITIYLSIYYSIYRSIYRSIYHSIYIYIYMYSEG